MKKIFVLFMTLIINSILIFAQKVDTTYFDKNWRGVKYKQLAQYIRYDFTFNDASYENTTRIFYLGGQLECEGTPISNNKLDGTKSLWKNQLTRYYPSGSKKQVVNYDNNGTLEGKTTSWDEKGNILSDQEFRQGVLHGKSVEYPSDNQDVCYITEFNNGQPVNNQTIAVYRSGRSVRLDYSTKKIITAIPSPTDCKTTSKDGITSWYYDINGIYIALNFTKTNQYGSYYQCFLVFNNNTNDPIEINPSNISGEYQKAGKSRGIELMRAEEYLAKIARSQAFSQALSGFASGMANYNAGYSTSTTSANAYGRGGWAHGTATTTTYSAGERQAILDREQQKLQNQAGNDQQVKEAIDGSILKRTTVDPGEKLVKAFYIKYLSADQLVVTFTINNIPYVFKMGKI